MSILSTNFTDPIETAVQAKYDYEMYLKRIAKNIRKTIRKDKHGQWHLKENPRVIFSQSLRNDTTGATTTIKHVAATSITTEYIQSSLLNWEDRKKYYSEVLHGRKYKYHTLSKFRVELDPVPTIQVQVGIQYNPETTIKTTENA